MRSIFFGRILLVAILSWAVLMVSSGAFAAEKADLLATVRQAAEQGDAIAQVSLSSLYYTEKNYAQAFKWAKKAADQGNAHAQEIVGVLYHEGQGVKQDYAQARLWFQKAKENGFDINDTSSVNDVMLDEFKHSLQLMADKKDAVAKKSVDLINSMQAEAHNGGNPKASNKDALTKKGIPPIPDSNDAWVFLDQRLEPNTFFPIKSYFAPSTIVRTQKPNGFMIWGKAHLDASLVGVGPRTNYVYVQYDCDSKELRTLASKRFDSKKIEVKTGSWSNSEDEDRKLILTLCNQE